MAKQSIDYQALTSELDQIITKLQVNDVPIDEAVALHARGQEIITTLEKYLADAENTVKAVTDKEA